ENLGVTREKILHRLRYHKAAGHFRSYCPYKNFGMTKPAEPAAKVYGRDGEALCRKSMYKPLGMTSTSSRYADFFARPNKALGHVLVDGKWVQKFKRDPDAQSPTGGVSSSVYDVAKRIRLQVDNGKYDCRHIVGHKAMDTM